MNSEKAEKSEMAEKHDINRTQDYLTTTQAARLLSVSPDTVLKWVKAGKVKSYRTLGGHFRIPISELDIPESERPAMKVVTNGVAAPSTHQYCWEYLAKGGEISPECKNCITYKSRAQRCYELKDLPGGFGCLNLMCDTKCEDCDYYQVAHGHKPRVLVFSDGKRLIKGGARPGSMNGFELEFARSEYEAAALIQSFRPDYIVVDCGFGKRRTAAICRHLFDDIRIPVVRIILSSKAREIDDYCDQDVFAWIKKPFTVEQLRECVEGVPVPNEQS
jgi:excisionase family DNA binding protein